MNAWVPAPSNIFFMIEDNFAQSWPVSALYINCNFANQFIYE